MVSSRPSDHFDAEALEAERLEESDGAVVAQPRLGILGYLRFFWRQLTSMRTALFLLLFLAFAAIPGSLVPQRTADPNGVVQYQLQHPVLYPILDKLQFFDTYSSVWFAAIYLLLFVSLIGCVVPRAKHHWDALRARPPRTPARLTRMAGYSSVPAPGVSGELALDSAAAILKRSGYRVERFPTSVSAERGYARETGNLVFHMALVGILIAIAVGGGFGYTGQRIVVVGEKFVNTLADYDTINPGPYVDTDKFTPYRVALNSFTVTYAKQNTTAAGQPTSYRADVTTTDEHGVTKKQVLKVNSPLQIGGTQAYLLGNGYAPEITVRNPAGDVVFQEAVPFLPQDPELTSQGVVKVPDGLAQQVGMIGFFYPTATQLSSGAFASSYPDLDNPVLSLEVYTGDLKINGGQSQSVYSLDTSKMDLLAGVGAKESSLQLTPGKVVDLPKGLGTIEMTSVPRYISLDVHHDPSQIFVLFFAVLVVLGLLSGLFIPRRRVWVKAVGSGGDLSLEYAGLARGEDPGLEAAIADIRDKHTGQLGIRVTQ